MNALLVILDGVSDRGTATPLSTAKTPQLDALAKTSCCGMMYSIGRGVLPGSDTSHLAIFGYDRVSNRLDDIIRAIAELGGTYPDVVQALYEAKVAGALECRLEIDALPGAGRKYDRVAKEESDEAEDSEADEEKPARGPLSRLLGKSL